MYRSSSQKYPEICAIQGYESLCGRFKDNLPCTASEEQGRAQLERVTEKWEAKYPNAMKSWEQNWDVISPIFKFSNDVRKVIYTTNAIESLNSTYKKLNRQRSVFPSDKAFF